MFTLAKLAGWWTTSYGVRALQGTRVSFTNTARITASLVTIYRQLQISHNFAMFCISIGLLTKCTLSLPTRCECGSRV